MKPLLQINKTSLTVAQYIAEIFNNKEVQGSEWVTIEYDYAHNVVKVWDDYGADELCLEFRDDVDALTTLITQEAPSVATEYFTTGYTEYNA